MHKRSSKKPPKDPNQLAKFIVDTITRSTEPESLEPEKNPAAVALGRLGGLKGGKARAQALSHTQRAAIAKKGAAARWKSKKP